MEDDSIYLGRVMREYSFKSLIIQIVVRVCLFFVLGLYGSWWKLRVAILMRKPCLLRRVLVLCYKRYMEDCASYIPLICDIRYPPCFPHGLQGIFVSSGAKIGRNVVIFQHVTIGSNTIAEHGGSSGGAPQIGNNVYIGAGAKIIGAVKIGDNCRIGAGCCVYKDMPPDSVAVSSPTRIIAKENLDNRFFSRENGRSLYYRDGCWVAGQ